ncbi:hypothetical protein [Nocardiopsis rhodophaea]|uniref:hypothetical protein n=1 Tax=Nocardiopsis rhodophaea TaxID=280238 RepID=UPI0031DAC2EF
MNGIDLAVVVSVYQDSRALHPDPPLSTHKGFAGKNRADLPLYYSGQFIQARHSHGRRLIDSRRQISESTVRLYSHVREPILISESQFQITVTSVYGIASNEHICLAEHIDDRGVLTPESESADCSLLNKSQQGVHKKVQSILFIEDEGSPKPTVKAAANNPEKAGRWLQGTRGPPWA